MTVERFTPEQSAFPALFQTEGDGGLAQVLEDNFGDEGFSPTDLDRVTVPAGGGTSWEIPDEEPTRMISGVLIHKQATRSFWFKARGEGGEDDGPPDCFSDDAKHGQGAFGPGSESNKTGLCAECPMNEWESSDRGSGKGKGCKEQMQLFLLPPESILPIQISLPPTSLRPWRKYMTRLASKGKSYMTVVTGLGLEVAKANGQTYSVVTPSKVAELDPMEGAAARGYGLTIQSSLEAAASARAQATQSEQEGNQKGQVSTDSAGDDAKK